MRRTALKRRTALRAKKALRQTTKGHRPRQTKLIETAPVLRRPRRIRLTSKDRDWATKVKERAGWRCEKDGAYFGPRAGARLQAAHIFSRSIRSLRHDLDNGVSLCATHHFWAHHEPIEFAEWLREYLGKERYDALRLRAKQVQKA